MRAQRHEPPKITIVEPTSDPRGYYIALEHDAFPGFEFDGTGPTVEAAYADAMNDWREHIEQEERFTRHLQGALAR